VSAHINIFRTGMIKIDFYTGASNKEDFIQGGYLLLMKCNPPIILFFLIIQNLIKFS